MEMELEKVESVIPQKTKKVVKFIPPDGGWGWMVLIGTATSNMFNNSMLSLFSLVYGDALEEMGHRTQGAAIVLSAMMFISNFSGPIAGALIKLTSSRFVAITGASFCTTGIFLSGFSTNIWHLMLTCGVLFGLGFGFLQNSSFVAINSYFKLRKSRAVGLANVGTGIGQTIMPHVVRYFLENYGFRGACMLLSSLSLHGIAGTMLIQPVEWHMKKVEEDVLVDTSQLLQQEKKEDVFVTKTSEFNKDARNQRSENLKSNCETETPLTDKQVNGKKTHKTDATGINGLTKKISTLPQKRTLLRKMYDLFGISLLSNLRFINVAIGGALAFTSVQNFSMLYPFFLQKVASMNKQQTANCMSAVAGADIAGRLILPIFQDKYKIKARWMMIMTSIWLVIVRQILAFQTNVEVLIFMSCLYGVGKSMIIVARNITLSEDCRMDQVPAAIGLGMLTMGIIVPPVGYFLGWIRDYTGSYITCITAQNMLLVILLVTWIPDMLYYLLKERRKKKLDSEQL